MRSYTLSGREAEEETMEQFQDFFCSSGAGKIKEIAEELCGVEVVGLKGNEIEGGKGCGVDGSTGFGIDIDGWTGGHRDGGEENLFSMVVGNNDQKNI